MFKESDMLELKQELNSDFKKEVVAFANTKGGKIYVGIDKKGKVLGVKNAEQDLEAISGMIREGIKSDLTFFTKISIRDIESKEVIEVEVLEGTNKPYHLAEKGIKPTGVFIRHGIASVPATEETIKMMLREYKDSSFEKTISVEQDLDFSYLIKSFENMGIDLDDSKLKTLNIKSKDLYTNLAFILSDKNTYTIKCGIYKDNTVSEFIDQKEFSGSLLEQLDSALKYLDLINKLNGKIIKYKRIDNKDYPEYAIRESLLNACIHRSFEFNGSIIVHVFADRMEIVSLGGLVKGVTIDDILEGVSETRNPSLANVFRKLDYVESFGTGIRRINESYEKYDVKPTFKATTNSFVVILPNTNYIESEIIDSDNLTNEEKIVNYIKRNSYMTRKDAESVIGLSKTHTIRFLEQLLKKGIIEKEGNNKSTKYILK